MHAYALAALLLIENADQCKPKVADRCACQDENDGGRYTKREHEGSEDDGDASERHYWEYSILEQYPIHP